MGSRDGLERTEVLFRRLDVLDRLCQSPAYVRDLVEETSQSRSTINRAITELEDIDLVERGDDGIEATVAGRLARDRLTTFLSEFDDILAAEAVLEPMSSDAAVDPAFVAGCEAMPTADPAPYRPVERLHDELADADRYRALVPTLEDPRHVRLLYEHVVTDGNPAELVVTPEVFRTLRGEFPRRMAAMAEEAGFSTFVGSVPPFGLGLLERESGNGTSSVGAHLVVLDERGSVHGILVNDADPAIEWATAQYEAYRSEATDRTSALIADADGGVRRLDVGHDRETSDRSMPVSLEREGFVSVDVSYFRDEPVADPPTAWRAGLSLAEVHTGYAVPRTRSTAADDPAANGSREADLAATLTAELTAGTDCVVVGPPGSGKSTICKQVACRWYEDGRGPVRYRDGDRGRAFTSVDDLVATVAAADGHALVVVEDAIRPDAVAVFDAVERLADCDDVSVLLDSRVTEWRDRAGPASVATDLEVVHVPPLRQAGCERLVDHFERTVGRSVDVSAERLWSAVHDETASDDGVSSELLRLIHRLSTYADPLADGPTALEEAVAAVYEELADDEVALSVAVLANALNAAGVGLDRGFLYAVAGDDRLEAVDDAIERLDGQVLFDGTDGRYRTVHEEWSTTFLAHTLEVDGEEAAARRFGTVVGELLALADDADRRERIERRLQDSWAFADVTTDPGSWADEVADAIYAVGRERSTLAPLFGDGTTDSIELPGACSDAIADERPVWLGGSFLAGGYSDRAERAFERLPREDPERLLGLARVALDRGEYDDAIDHARACLSLVEEEPVVRARARVRLGEAMAERGEYDDATAQYRTALSAFRDDERPRWTARTLRKIAAVATEWGEYDEARECYESSLELVRELGDRRGEADALNDLGTVCRRQGAYDRASELFERSLEHRRELGDRRGEATTLHDLGIVATRQGAYDRARELYERALDRRRELGDRHGEAETLYGIGLVAIRRGQYDRARRFYGLALDGYRELGDRHSEAKAVGTLGFVATKTGRYDRARELYERALEINSELGDRHSEGRALHLLGDLAVRRGRYDRARELFERSLELNEELDDRHDDARLCHSLGVVHMEQGRYGRARELFERSLGLRAELDDRHGEAIAATDRGRLAVRRGNDDRAKADFERGLAVATEIGKPDQIARSRSYLAELAIREGASDRAREHLDAARDALEGDEDTIALRVRLARARLAVATDDLESARSVARRAHEGFDALDAVHWAARSERLRGRIAAAADEHDAARDHLVEALETFEGIGAYHDALTTLEVLVDTDEDADRWVDRARSLSSEAPEDVLERRREWLTTDP